jgi:hypothetical protein
MFYKWSLPRYAVPVVTKGTDTNDQMLLLSRYKRVIAYDGAGLPEEVEALEDYLQRQPNTIHCRKSRPLQLVNHDVWGMLIIMIDRPDGLRFSFMFRYRDAVI